MSVYAVYIEIKRVNTEEDLDCKAPADCTLDSGLFKDDEARVYHANGMVVHQFDELVF